MRLSRRRASNVKLPAASCCRRTLIDKINRFEEGIDGIGPEDNTITPAPLWLELSEMAEVNYVQPKWYEKENS